MHHEYVLCTHCDSTNMINTILIPWWSSWKSFLEIYRRVVENLRSPGSKENAEGKNLCVLNNFFFLLKHGGNAERKNLFVPRLIICFFSSKNWDNEEGKSSNWIISPFWKDEKIQITSSILFCKPTLLNFKVPDFSDGQSLYLQGVISTDHVLPLWHVNPMFRMMLIGG